MTKTLTAGERYVIGEGFRKVSHTTRKVIAESGDKVTLVAINGDIAICDNRNKTRFSIHKSYLK